MDAAALMTPRIRRLLEEVRVEGLGDPAEDPVRRWERFDRVLRGHLAERGAARRRGETAPVFRRRLVDLRHDIVEADKLMDTADVSHAQMKRFVADRLAWDRLMREAEVDEAAMAAQRVLRNSAGRCGPAPQPALLEGAAVLQ